MIVEYLKERTNSLEEILKRPIGQEAADGTMRTKVIFEETHAE